MASISGTSYSEQQPKDIDKNYENTKKSNIGNANDNGGAVV